MHVRRAADGRLVLTHDDFSDSDTSVSDEEQPSAAQTHAAEAEEASHAEEKSGKAAKQEEINQEDVVALQLLAVETRRLDFEVDQWKQQLALRRERLRLKADEIASREATTRLQQQTQVMELRARILQALNEAGKPPSQASKYLALLEG